MTSCAGSLTRESPAALLVQPDVPFTCGHADRNRVWIAIRCAEAQGVDLVVIKAGIPAGELDCASTPDLSVPLTKLVAKRPPRRVLDLADVMFMDCAGITHIARHAVPSRQVPAVLQTRPHVRQLLMITHMNQLRMIQDG